VTSLLETFGIALVGPFIALATNTKLIYQNSKLNSIYNQYHFDSEVQFILLLGIAVVIILYLKAFLGFQVQKYIFKFGFTQEANLRSRLMNAYLEVPYVFHLSRNTAVSIQLIINETRTFANRVLMPILFSASNFTVILFLSILLLKTDLIATASMLLVLLIVSYVLYQFKDRIARWGKELHEADIEMMRIINHGLGSFKETRVIGCESFFENQLSEQAKKFKISVTAYNAFSALPRYTLEPILVTFLVGFTSTYLILDRSSENLAATLGVFGMTSIRLLPAASNFMQSIGEIKNTSFVIDRLYWDFKELEKNEVSQNKKRRSRNVDLDLRESEVVNTKYLLKCPSNYLDSINFDKNVSLDKIFYQYPNCTEPALQDISLAINKGDSIGLIGRSGAGKTTLVDVILGLLIPDSGDIKVDGKSVINNLRAWQNLIGYIPQTIFLIDDTIERNIAFGIPDEQIDRQKLKNAISAAQLDELIERLPDGIKTAVGERGIRLSGGQRQRVGIARALYHEREILVLDEATAALDNETENLVTESIKALSGKKTMIIIAHRLSTIEHCDRIYLMEKGQIVKSGSYQEVVLQEIS
jgi:ABC-type multidrug transport system fused ATPase/permease subunit